MDYRVIYSKRRTLAITVRDATVVVRAPRGIGRDIIEKFVNKHERWINEKLALQRKAAEKVSNLTESDIKKLKNEAKIYFKQKLDYYSALMGLKYSTMKITSAEKRFGSCNSRGTICFSYRLMLYPEAARDYVVVHEIAHLKHMNHSKDFYKLIERYMPDYKERKRLLK